MGVLLKTEVAIWAGWHETLRSINKSKRIPFCLPHGHCCLLVKLSFGHGPNFGIGGLVWFIWAENQNFAERGTIAERQNSDTKLIRLIFRKWYEVFGGVSQAGKRGKVFLRLRGFLLLRPRCFYPSCRADLMLTLIFNGTGHSF